MKRRKTAAKARRPAVRKRTVRKARPRTKPARKFPLAPARAARVPRARFSLRKLTARLTPQVKPPIEAYRGTKPYIFASYSHKNMKEVFGVIKKLAGARYRVWYDEGIEPGNEWPEEVGKALTGCQLFVVFMSPAAMDSRNVRIEINFASGENKSVMVVNLQPVELSEGMKLQIGTVQFINKHEMSDTEFIEKMKRVLSPDLRL
ncbi:MAG: toll/interleukin-1 receptor domain-containing protein [Spirochaetia bacterium]